MSVVTTETMYQALLVIFILLMSKGWKIVRQSLNRRDVSNYTIAMSSCYLLYSAYYVTISIQSMLFILNFMLTLMYIMIFMTVISNSVDTLDLV